MSNHVHTAAGVLLLGLLVSVQASAAPPHKGLTAASEYRPALFRVIDRNHDGIVTRDEYMADRDHRFQKKAVGNRIAYDAESAQLFAKRDRNGDGKLTSDEFPPAADFQASPRMTGGARFLDPGAEGRRPRPAPSSWPRRPRRDRAWAP